MKSRQATALPCKQLTVADTNYDIDRQYPINGIVLHTIVGTVKGADARFNKVGSKVSAHYGIGLDGTLYQWVDEDKVAYASGNYPINQSTIAIEHEDNWNGQPPEPERSDLLYEASARLVAEICAFYGFPADEKHILLHKNVIDRKYYPGGTACPDKLDTERIMKRAADILVTLTPPPAPPAVTQTHVEVDATVFTNLVHNSTVSDQVNDYFGLPHNSDFSAIKQKLDAFKGMNTITTQEIEAKKEELNKGILQLITAFFFPPKGVKK